MDYNPAKSLQLQQEPKYMLFNQWLRQNGAIFDKVSNQITYHPVTTQNTRVLGRIPGRLW